MPAPAGSAGASRSVPAGFWPLWTTVLVDLIGFGIVLPILPLYSERHGATPLQATLLVTVFSLAQFVCAPIWGRLSDRIGRKPLLLLSLSGTAVGSLLTGFAGSLPLLFIARALDGASGGSVSIAQAAVADMAAPEQRARLMGLMGAAFGIGFVLGPALGATAGIGGSERAPFFLAAALAGANAVAAAVRLKETRPTQGLAGAGPAAHGSGPAHASGWRRDLAHAWRTLRPGVVVAFVATAAFSAFEATFSLFGDRRLGLTTRAVGVVFALVGVVLALVHARVAPRVVQRRGTTTTLGVGLAVSGIGLVVLAPAQNLLVAGCGLLLICVGTGCSSTALNAWVADRAAAHERGRSFGTLQSAQALARVAGPAAGGLLFTHLGSGGPFWVAGVILLAAGLLWRAHDRRGPVGAATD